MNLLDDPVLATGPTQELDPHGHGGNADNETGDCGPHGGDRGEVRGNVRKGRIPFSEGGTSGEHPESGNDILFHGANLL